MPAPHHSVFLQAGCPFCRPTNRVKALKAWHQHYQYINCLLSYLITYDWNMLDWWLTVARHLCRYVLKTLSITSLTCTETLIISFLMNIQYVLCIVTYIMSTNNCFSYLDFIFQQFCSAPLLFCSVFYSMLEDWCFTFVSLKKFLFALRSQSQQIDGSWVCYDSWGYGVVLISFGFFA